MVTQIATKNLLSIRLLLGFYFNICGSKFICYSLKLYSIGICFFLSYLHFRVHGFYVPFTVTILEYMINVIISVITNQSYIFKYSTAIRICDKVMGIGDIMLVNIHVYIILVLCVICRMVIGRFHHIGFSFDGSSAIIIGVDLTHIVPALIFRSIYLRIKLIRRALTNNYVPVNIVGKYEADRFVIIVRKCLLYYNNLLDTMQYFYRDLQILFIISLVANVPKWVFTLHNVISQLFHADYDDLVVGSLLDTIYAILVMCSSALMAELIMNEIDQMKSTLATQLFRCSDESLRFEMEIMLRYLNLRPFGFVVARTVPLNVNLPFSIGGFCITYVIIAIQLNHFRVL